QATSTRGVRARIRRVAGCAPPTGSAGHAGATANLKLTFHLDHSAGADQYGVPEFIKIDVEGYELNILRGLSYRIPFITIEYHSDQRSIAATRECISRLSSFGPVEINVIAENNHDLVLPCWLEGQEFLNQFPNCVAQH